MLLLYSLGAAVKMEHFQAALDPRKQELLEARFTGARVSLLLFYHVTYWFRKSDVNNFDR